MNEEAEVIKFGGIDFSGKDIAIPEQKFSQIAISGRSEVLLLTVIADQMRVKAIRAIFCGGAKATCNASGVKVSRPGDANWQAHTPGRVNPVAEGYTLYTHKLGYNMVHAMFIARTPGFMKVVSEESLWQELTSARFTTPILRGWVPYINMVLRTQEKLEDAHAFNCHCGILSASTKCLDEIVSDGLSSGQIVIPRLMSA